MSYQGTGTQPDLDNHANHANPNNKEYAGHKPGYQGTGDKADLHNHYNQCNSNNQEFGGGQTEKK